MGRRSHKKQDTHSDKASPPPFVQRSEVFWLDGSPEAMEKAAEAGFCTLPSEYSQWPQYYDALPA